MLNNTNNKLDNTLENDLIQTAKLR
ncbi:MAG: hypothetical protein ACI86M_003996 [Saprospiraceae bacterium]